MILPFPTEVNSSVSIFLPSLKCFPEYLLGPSTCWAVGEIGFLLNYSLLFGDGTKGLSCSWFQRTQSMVAWPHGLGKQNTVVAGVRGGGGGKEEAAVPLMGDRKQRRVNG